MSLPLLLFGEHGITPCWQNFYNHVRTRCGEDSEIVPMADTLLKQYGARTDWEDQDDPLWFDDEDNRIRFVLEWS